MTFVVIGALRFNMQLVVSYFHQHSHKGTCKPQAPEVLSFKPAKCFQIEDHYTLRNDIVRFWF